MIITDISPMFRVLYLPGHGICIAIYIFNESFLIDQLREFILQAFVDIDANLYLCVTVCCSVRFKFQE